MKNIHLQIQNAAGFLMQISSKKRSHFFFLGDQRHGKLKGTCLLGGSCILTVGVEDSSKSGISGTGGWRRTGRSEFSTHHSLKSGHMSENTWVVWTIGGERI
jgi:hypothetical protein